MDSSPVVCGNKVVVGSDDGRIYMVSLDKGQELWSYEIGSPVDSSPAVADGKLVIGSDDGNVYAFGNSEKNELTDFYDLPETTKARSVGKSKPWSAIISSPIAYPPFSVLGSQENGWVILNAALERPPRPGNPLGVYLHIPFCRKRCHFCYFRVYTDKDSAAIKNYIDTALKEFAIYAAEARHQGNANPTSFILAVEPRHISHVGQLRHLCLTG